MSDEFNFRPDLVPADFPVAEIFGFPPDAESNEARHAREQRLCPFKGGICTKLLSAAGTGICSVRYRAEGFDESIWAVCANRLRDTYGDVMKLHFGDATPSAELVPEVRISNPTMSFDAVAVRTTPEDDVEFVGIEAQTIDTRGGSLRPLWQAYVDGRPDDWRSYYGGARPLFGVNTTNVWKRLLPQAMNKGRMFADWDSKLFVVLQDAVFQFIARRMPLKQLTKQERARAEIIWVRWDYTGERDRETGQLVTELAEPVFTTVDQVAEAFVTIHAAQRPVFVAGVLAKRKRDGKRLAALEERVEREAREQQERLFRADPDDASG